MMNEDDPNVVYVIKDREEYLKEYQEKLQAHIEQSGYKTLENYLINYVPKGAQGVV